MPPRTRTKAQLASVQPALVDDVSDSSDEDDTSPAPANVTTGLIRQCFEVACVQDPVAHLRKIVIKIQSSGQRRDTFMTWIDIGNKNGSFVLNNKAVQIQPKQLLRDVRTRWDSTYQMIKRCIEMRSVSLQFIPCFL